MLLHGLVPSGSSAWIQYGNTKLSVTAMFLGPVFQIMLFFHRIMNRRTTSLMYWLRNTGTSRLNMSFRDTEIFNECGVCFSLESRQSLKIPLIDLDRFRSEILKDLTLVHGIGPRTQTRLMSKGFRSLPDLMQHPKFRSYAHEVLKCLNSGNSAEIMDLIGCRHAKSHPSVLGTAGLHEPEDYVFLDIETLGLFSRPIILFGIGYDRERQSCRPPVPSAGYR